MIIGRFSENADGTLVGHIRTVFFKSDAVVFEPFEVAKSENAPGYVAYTGDKIELGAAWKRRARQTGSVFYDVKIDDPTFSEAIWCRLVQAKDGSGYVLVWQRTITTRTAA